MNLESYQLSVSCYAENVGVSQRAVGNTSLFILFCDTKSRHANIPFKNMFFVDNCLFSIAYLSPCFLFLILYPMNIYYGLFWHLNVIISCLSGHLYRLHKNIGRRYRFIGGKILMLCSDDTNSAGRDVIKIIVIDKSRNVVVEPNFWEKLLLV